MASLCSEPVSSPTEMWDVSLHPNSHYQLRMNNSEYYWWDKLKCLPDVCWSDIWFLYCYCFSGAFIMRIGTQQTSETEMQPHPLAMWMELIADNEQVYRCLKNLKNLQLNQRGGTDFRRMLQRCFAAKLQEMFCGLRNFPWLSIHMRVKTEISFFGDLIL